MYVLGLNGPPQCGKDSLAQMLADRLDQLGARTPCIVMPLSYPLRLIAHDMVGEDYDPDEYEDFKNREFVAFPRRTGRQLMIDVSESFLKPTYGQDIMSRIFFERLAAMDFDGVVIVPDNGFKIEASYIHQMVGADNYYVVRVHRDGTDFSGDSREWVHITHDCDVDNNSTLEDLESKAAEIWDRLINNLRWQIG